jgi:hypothetical protein
MAAKGKNARNKRPGAAAAGGKKNVQRGRSGSQRRGAVGGFSLAKAIWRVEAEHLTDLAQDVSALSGSISADATGRNRIKVMLLSLAEDSRYSVISPVFGQIQAKLDAGDWIGARNSQSRYSMDVGRGARNTMWGGMHSFGG